MSDVAIRVENLGKLYRIGAAQPRYKTLRESLVDTFRRGRSWWREWARIRHRTPKS